MNIFYLSNDPIGAAKQMPDRHVVKMSFESCQMLANAYYVQHSIYSLKNLTAHQLELIKNSFVGFPRDVPYKISHIHHPCSVWVYGSLDNWKWLLEHAKELCRQYILRYAKILSCEVIVNWFSENLPDIASVGLTNPAQAMPEIYKNPDPILAYQYYYLNEKNWSFWKLGNLTIPEFWKKYKSEQIEFLDLLLTKKEKRELWECKGLFLNLTY